MREKLGKFGQIPEDLLASFATTLYWYTGEHKATPRFSYCSTIDGRCRCCCCCLGGTKPKFQRIKALKGERERGEEREE